MSSRARSKSARSKSSKADAEPVEVAAVVQAAVAPAAKPHAAHFEFGGPYIGPIGIFIGLPLLCIIFTYWVAQPAPGGAGKPIWPQWPWSKEVLDAVQGLTADAVFATLKSLVTLESFGVYCVYFLWHVLLHLFVPGPTKKGVKLTDGRHLPYLLNGLTCFCLTVVMALGVQRYKWLGQYDLVWVYDHWAEVTMATIIFSWILSFFLYFYSFKADAQLADHGHTGYAIYDFFIGRELNPRVLNGQLDLKFFCELRPGLTMWVLLNFACAFAQYERVSKGVGIDAWMGFVLFAQGYYVLDAVMNEEAILTTMDITTDGFGFMLAFGDLAWVPATYGLQARYLSQYYAPLTSTADYVAFAGTVALFLLGIIIFRGSNGQKDAFKSNPNAPQFADFKTIPTDRGTKLLADGWWGKSRHINYLGDWLMSIAMCLPCGTQSCFAYFYPIYFAVLLIHREIRDEEKCSNKYGAAWAKYKQAVPYRIIPYIY